MKPLKLAFLSYRSSPLSGGQGIYLKNVCEALLRQGHDITVFSGEPLPKLTSKIKLVKIETPGYFETFSFGERIKIFQSLQKKDLFEFKDFFEAITGVFSEPKNFGDRLSLNNDFLELKDSFDIFHDNQSISNYPSFMHKKLVTTLHHPIHVDKELDLKFETDFFLRLAIKRWYSFLEVQKKNLKQSRLVITPSNNSKKDIKKYFNFPESFIEVIWNGINLEEHKAEAKTDFNGKLISIISSDVPMKNLSNLIKGFAIAREKIQGLTLTIIGDIREKNLELIDQLNLNDSINYLPKLAKENLLTELQNADIGISASLYEGFGFPLIEMMASGLPVIVSNRGSLPELMGNAGICFDPEDINDLSIKIVNMAQNHALRDDFAKQSTQRRDDFFDWDEYAKRLVILYHKIINGHI